ncbi:histidinol-phosphatase [Terricaulis silvestris]|uniref:Histidinol-phosphatase n=1 Tax=Terricaulis silvestris TaxID=2686094 RepID=A0A6I6MPZ4_9CAUL|nr:histidinol-phosphatase [Terricaulis silvestris]QGZ96789.1 Histidinol-phosphatase [Terricaulis silvestris]
MTPPEAPRLLTFADTLADAARAAILPYFRAAHTVESKGALFDPVTDADKAAERAMRTLIEREFPDHSVLGEEYGGELSRSGYQWILDPIDGTRAFISGLPLWGVLIGLYHDGRPLIGVMDQPYLDERYRGWNDGANLTAQGVTRPLKTRACAGLGDAILSTTDPYLFKGDEADAFARVRAEAKLTRYGYDCYAYAMVASGTMDCVVESGLKPFDIAALIPILTGAGGGVCAWDGGDASAGGRALAYGDERIRNAALDLLAR